MKLWMYESRRYVIERAKGSEAISCQELSQALQSIAGGWSVMAIQNRDDGTTVVHMQSTTRKSVPLTRVDS